MKYPYYIVIRHEGRLPVPLQYRGTVIAKQFESGRIGGRRAIEKQTDDRVDALRLFREARIHDSSAEVYVVEAPNRYRSKLRDPLRELQH